MGRYGWWTDSSPGVKQEEAAVLEQAIGGLEIGPEVLGADVLEHAHGHDVVVLALGVAIIHEEGRVTGAGAPFSPRE
jgi:hypothetical protein